MTVKAMGWFQKIILLNSAKLESVGCMIFCIKGIFLLNPRYTFVITKKFMKKVAALMLLMVVLLASCSEYTCPTYSKKPASEQKSVRI